MVNDTVCVPSASSSTRDAVAVNHARVPFLDGVSVPAPRRTARKAASEALPASRGQREHQPPAGCPILMSAGRRPRLLGCLPPTRRKTNLKMLWMLVWEVFPIVLFLGLLAFVFFLVIRQNSRDLLEIEGLIAADDPESRPPGAAAAHGAKG